MREVTELVLTLKIAVKAGGDMIWVGRWGADLCSGVWAGGEPFSSRPGLQGMRYKISDNIVRFY